MLRVLLVAPTDPKIPGNLKYLVGGENTYCQTLLSNPPKGVRYTYFMDALAKGLVEYSTLQRVLSLLVKLRILPVSGGSQVIKLKAKFDLVHCHAYSIKVTPSVPIILSDSSSNYIFLRDYVNWPEWRIKFGYFLRKQLFGILGVVDSDTNPNGAKKLIVFSEFARKIHKKLGVLESKMVVVRPGLSFPRKRESSSGFRIKSGMTKEVNILFVGTWFERKGGPILLEAFRRLSKKYSNVRLTIVGEVPKNVKCQMSNVKCYNFVPREKLIKEFFPSADIFVLVPPKVEGFGFSVIEAMSFGVVPIVSNVCALPELVLDGKSGFVVEAGSVEELTKRLESLIKNQAFRKKMGNAAKKRFEEQFSIKKSNRRLLEVYKNVLL